MGRRLGPIYERKLLNTRFPVVCGAVLCAECGDESNWRRGLAGPTLKLRSIARSGMFTARTSDPLWAAARKVLNPGFAQEALRRYHDAIGAVADELTQSWNDSPVDLHDSMTKATLEVIARAGFSRSFNLFSGEDDPEVLNMIGAVNTILSWASESSNDVPLLGDIRGYIQQRMFRGDLERARAFIDQIVLERAESKETYDDLLDLMLSSRDAEEGAPELPLDNVRDQVLTMLIAGHETTAALLETTLWYLAQNPDWVREIRKEVFRRGLTYDGVAGMRTTRNVLSEVLRLWPPVPAYFRVSVVDQSLGGFDIPAGQIVSVLALAAQRDTAAWGDDADEFKPGRWSASELRKYPNRFYQPFGTGPRSCIGRAFAMQEATLIIASIIARFDFSLAEGDSMKAPAMYERGTLRPVPFRLNLTEVRQQSHEG